MKYGENPFDELYVSETIPPSEYVRVFSPALVDQAQALFQSGNVVLEGQQGSGKTMLLSLFKPSVRIAYEQASADFPVRDAHSEFVAAGINLGRSAALDFGQRPIEGEVEELPVYFGDFLNYWVLYDLLASIESYRHPAAEGIRDRLQVDFSEEALDRFADRVSSLSCWFGYLEGVESIVGLRGRIEERIQAYRAFLNYNRESLPRDIRKSKTAVGTAISAAAQTLRETGVLGENVEIFVRIDQYESLSRLEELREGELGRRYAAIVNKALALRDPEVFFRIGTRSYAWRDEELRIHGTSSVLEEERDYTVVDLDEILQRPENPSTWIFPEFAQDVFRRRLAGSELYETKSDGDDYLRRVFGDGLDAEEEARRYAGSSPGRVVTSEVGWPRKWVTFLENLAANNPLSAKLGEAWARQRRGSRLKEEDPPCRKPYPWESDESWRKERVEQALTQIANLCRERRLWGGKKDILTLTGGNILVFVSLCRHVWSSWLRATRNQDRDGELPSISVDVQAVGLQIASRYWFDKIREWSGGGARQRFITLLGGEFRERLVKDRSMSYPGHNGISVVREELEGADDQTRRFLADAVDFGDLQYREHASKKKQDRRERIKFYLKQALSPHFQIPATHVKEPVYMTIRQVEMRIEKAIKGQNIKSLGRFEQAAAGDSEPDEQLPLPIEDI